MFEFCRVQSLTRIGHIRLGLLCSIVFIVAMVFGMLVVAQPYAVYATGEKVADPYVVKVDGVELVVVDSRESGEAVIDGLKLAYADTVSGQQQAQIENQVSIEKYTYPNSTEHPVVMNVREATDYVLELNESSKKPVVSVKTTEVRTVTEAIPYDTVEEETYELYVGEKDVKKEGKDGLQEVTESVTMVNGEVKDRDVLSKNVLEEPVDEVAVVGVRTVIKPGDPGAGAGISGAYSMLGVPYVSGGMSASGVDCSGLINVVYGGARGRTTYAMIDSLQATGDWKTSMDQLVPGDLVFTGPGHVGIYVGGGQMIHAPVPGKSVSISPVWSFYGGGTY